MATLHFEIGKEYTLTKTFAESDVYLFAGIIGDLFPAHVNEEYCKRMPYKTRLPDVQPVLHSQRYGRGGQRP